MSIDDAKAFMKRMREDAEFKRQVSEREDKEENWAFVKSQGYDFSLEEFKLAQEEIMKELGIPKWS